MGMLVPPPRRPVLGVGGNDDIENLIFGPDLLQKGGIGRGMGPMVAKLQNVGFNAMGH